MGQRAQSGGECVEIGIVALCEADSGTAVGYCCAGIVAVHGGAMALKMIWQIQKMSVPCTTKASGMQSRLPKKSKFNQNRFAYKKHLYSEPLKKGAFTGTSFI